MPVQEKMNYIIDFKTPSSTLHHLPDPISSTNEGNYKTFDEVFCEVTDENGRPSAKPKKDKETSKRLFSIEKQYYSSGQEPICVYCGCLQNYTSPDHYPQCPDCKNKDPIHK